jgi:hypothetical protein
MNESIITLSVIFSLMTIIITAHKHRAIFQKVLDFIMKALLAFFKIPMLRFGLTINNFSINTVITPATIIIIYMYVAPYIIRIGCHCMGVMLALLSYPKGSVGLCFFAYGGMALVGEVEFYLLRTGFRKTQIANNIGK